MDKPAPKYAYEDMVVGLTLPLGPRTVSKADILEFAREFDPQPFHLDEEAGKASPLGGLAASGWHTLALLMRMMCDAWLDDSTSQGAPGVEFNRWKKPVLAGDTLSGTTTVKACRLSRSRPWIGLVTLHHELVNQRGEMVCEIQHPVMMARRADGAAQGGAA
ncbi:MAG: MaoC family dehydratase [Rhizobiales bacterium]|nr:MaoC family dehydratase [Hyphomicrobiales bacterium]OJX98510.1 MAG: enoyl-CoA hydratase [Rhizobiales bacterium 63-22]